MTVTFCGHSDCTPTEALRIWLTDTVESLIQSGATTFYLGGYGSFDGMAASVVKLARTRHPHIECILVLAYLNQQVDARGYTCTLYPPLETVPQRFAITKRNRWMVENSHVLIDCITHSWGGAAQTLAYAKRRNLRIISFP